MRLRICLFSTLLLVACQGEAPGFDTPECVLYDEVDDVYLVSNIHGAPLAKDGNGYISRVRPDGTMQRRWITGGVGGVTLHAPKGMAFAGGVLWVADIDVLRKFDRSGKPLGEVVLPGAMFVNDVSAGPDGAVYCTDTGMDAQFAPSGTDAIFCVAKDGTVSTLVKSTDLGQPNGLVATAAGVYVVSWRDGTFFQIDYQGKRTDLCKAPSSQLDGLVRVPATDQDTQAAWYATSWQGACVYRFDVTGACVALEKRIEQPADCGFDHKRRQLLVPLFGSNKVEVMPL